MSQKYVYLFSFAKRSINLKKYKKTMEIRKNICYNIRR